jgi:hypothetical protein
MPNRPTPRPHAAEFRDRRQVSGATRGPRRGWATLLPRAWLAVALAAQPAAAQHAVPSHLPPALQLPALELPPLPLPHGDNAAAASVADDRQPRRETRRGLRIGAVTGAIVGAGIGSLIAVWCEAMGDGCLAAIPIVTVLGTASGAAAGAIIGAAIPAERAPAPPGGAVQPAPAVDRRIGSFSMSVGDAQATLIDEGEQHVLFDGGGIAVRANVYAELRPWFAIGPDLGVAWFGDAGTIRHAAVGVRGSWPLTPAFAPYISANAGAYDSSSPSLEYLGGGLGLGFRVTPVRGNRAFLDLEARSSRNLQNIAPMRMRTLSVGGGVYW